MPVHSVQQQHALVCAPHATPVCALVSKKLLRTKDDDAGSDDIPHAAVEGLQEGEDGITPGPSAPP